MKAASYEELFAILNAHDVWDHYSTAGDAPFETKELAEQFASYFADSREQKLAVLGLDIYRYSKYPNPQQRLIPLLFESLYRTAVAFCRNSEKYLFQTQPFDTRFISTGDGGFQVFDTPLHAVAFAAYFQLAVTAYNASFHFPRLRQLLGPITLRYALTFDIVFQLERNFFGAAIINNARIISRDALNRFLLDGSSHSWFVERIGTFESLTSLRNDELPRFPEFASYDVELRSSALLFPLGRPGSDVSRPNFRTVIAQRIGEISAKGTTLDIYNVYVQVPLRRIQTEGEYQRDIVVTLGNLNTDGISV